jgi:hypothetical protein
VTSLIAKIGVTAASGTGSTVWFDNVDMRKEGLLGQNLVEFLLDAWNGVYNSVYNTPGAVGKIWSDFVNAVAAINFDAGEALEQAGDAATDIIGVIDGVGQAVFGDAAYSALPQTAKQSIRKLVGTLFGVGSAVLDKIAGTVLPPIDATTLTGDVPVGNLPTEQLLPGSGNAAIMTRNSTANVGLTPGATEILPANFYTNSINPTGSGITPSVSQGRFTVTQAGWYLVLMGFRINPGAQNGWNFAPVLYKNNAIYRYGGDFTGDAFRAAKYAQSSFIIYLAANDYVQAGTAYEATFATGLLDSDGTGKQTYFEIALLNKTI